MLSKSRLNQCLLHIKLIEQTVEQEPNLEQKNKIITNKKILKTKPNPQIIKVKQNLLQVIIKTKLNLI